MTRSRRVLICSFRRIRLYRPLFSAPADVGQLHGPVGVAIDKEDRLVIVNETGNTVVRVDPKRPHEIALLAGAYRSKVGNESIC
jgi:hypothetical protein